MCTTFRQQEDTIFYEKQNTVKSRDICGSGGVQTFTGRVGSGQEVFTLSRAGTGSGQDFFFILRRIGQNKAYLSSPHFHVQISGLVDNPKFQLQLQSRLLLPLALGHVGPT